MTGNAVIFERLAYFDWFHFWRDVTNGGSTSIVSWILSVVFLLVIGLVVGFFLAGLAGEEHDVVGCASIFLIPVFVLIAGLVLAVKMSNSANERAAPPDVSEPMEKRPSPPPSASEGGSSGAAPPSPTPELDPKDLGAACRGKAVSGASGLRRTGTNKVLVFDNRGYETDFSDEGADWVADEPSQAALVACLRPRYFLIEACSYSATGTHGEPIEATIRRFREDLSVRIVAAASGRQIGMFELSNSPMPCPDATYVGSKEYGHVSFDRLAKSIANYAYR